MRFQITLIVKFVGTINTFKIKTQLKIEDLIDVRLNPFEVENISEIIENKTIIVTGGAGSIGSAIVRKLIKYVPKEIIVLDHAETALHNLTLDIESEIGQVILRPVICDIRNKKYVEYLFKSYMPDMVFHCAAYKHVSMMEVNPFEAIAVNLEATKTLADMSVNFNVDRFIMISTDKAVAPTSLMGVTKLLAESYIRSLSKDSKNVKNKFITTRFGNVLGSNGSVVELFTKQLERGHALTITDTNVSRYFITLDEVSKLLLEASCLGHGGELFIFDMGEPIKILDLAKKLAEMNHKELEFKIIGLRPGEKLHEEMVDIKSRIEKTLHPKIFKVQRHNKNVIPDIALEEIIQISKTYDKTGLIKKLEQIIPDFRYSNLV